MLLLIDNYDSFTYNLYQYLAELGASVEVLRNDAFTVEELKERAYRALVISPGPSRPEGAPRAVEAIQAFYRELPILGVCLGHQCIGYAFGAEIVRAKRIMHGKVSQIAHDGSPLFEGLGNPFPAGRYHSLVVSKETLPKEFAVTATSEDGEIMAIAHRRFPLYGIQFHPESVLTPSGKKLLQNFCALVHAKKTAGKSSLSSVPSS